MVERFSGGALQSRAIYPSRFLPYIGLLAVTKLLHSAGIFLSYDILQILHVVQFLFLVKAGSAVVLLVLQRPFSGGKKIRKQEWLRIWRHAFFGCLLQVLWLYALTLCGPLRTLLLYEHNSLVVTAAMSALFTSASTPARFRGAIFFVLAIMGLLLFDHDHMGHHKADNPEHQQLGFISHLFHHITDLAGLSDHKGGVVLLVITLCVQTGYSIAAKKLSVDIGGAKRLNALSTLASAALLLPWALFISYTRESSVASWTPLILPLVLIALVVFVADFYVEAVCASRLEPSHAARLGAMATFVWALVLSGVWRQFLVAMSTPAEHLLSGGAVFSFVLFMFATSMLTSPLRASKGSLVGFSAAGLPLYSFTGDMLQRTSHSAATMARHGLRQILSDADSRRIFYFLCINLLFAFVELTYGVWNNSLGLISDGFHMLFDCSALVMGLYAAVMSHWKATRIFSYGYDRVEILSGFINAIFLIVIAFFVFVAGLARLFNPPEIHTEKLLVVSVVGFFINIIGIMSFSHAHSHAGGGGHGHSHAGGGGHAHSHAGGGGHAHSHESHGHSHGGHGHAHGGQTEPSPSSSIVHNTNMEGVFLHVLADTLGSVGVIISTLLIEAFDWRIADPICTLFIASLIFLSVVPLVKRTSLILLLQTPAELTHSLGDALRKLSAVEGVVSFRNEHFWRHSSKVVAGVIHVQVTAEASDQNVVSQVTALLKEAGVHNISVQVEKAAFIQHLSGLGASSRQLAAISDSVRRLPRCNDSDGYVTAI